MSEPENDSSTAPARPQRLWGGGSDRNAIDSQALFAGRREIEIRHEGKVYRLRITRNGKLILNK